MTITYRMTPNQANAMDDILCACHQNESEKGVDLLDTIWTERCEMVKIQAVDGIIAWTLPRWFPLEMIVEQYGPELEPSDSWWHSTIAGQSTPDCYDLVAPLFNERR